MHRQTGSAASQRRLKFVFRLHRAASRREQAMNQRNKKPRRFVGGVRVSCVETMRSPGAARRHSPSWFSHEGY
jgi:hypothetical protein